MEEFMGNAQIQTRTFGRNGPSITAVGLGGEGVLRTYGKTEAARAVIQEALTQGITYFDSARAYAGSQGYYGTIWSQNPELRNRVFQASKSASRDREAALADLEDTLAKMGTDRLDLWQIHDVRSERDLQTISGAGGALEAFLEAKASGKVRFIGVTGHQDPGILTRAVEEWPVDSVMMPVNPAEGALTGFLDSTLPLARAKGVAVIGMKTLGQSHYLQPEGGLTADMLIRYALAQEIDVAIVGCSSPEEVKTLADVGRDPRPMSEEEQKSLVDAFRPHAGRLAFYRGA
jgi:aryl-alcohol dehydrogenase-like predicted oxidoreductase